MACTVLAGQQSDDKNKMIEIAICGDIEDSYLGIGVMAVKQLDSSRFAINFHMMEEWEAREALLQGELTAYIVVPEGFVDSVVRGENHSIRYYAANGQAGIGTMLMHELSMIISELITKSQSGIYGMQSICLDYGYHDIYWDATNTLNLKYIDLILDRPELFEVEILGVSNQLSTVGYYVCGFTVLFLLLFGINGCPIYVKKDMSLSVMLSSKGIPGWAQVLVEWFSYLALLVTNVFCIMTVLGVAAERLGLKIPEWRTLDLDRVLEFALSLLPIMFLLAAMAIFMYEITENILSGMLFQFMAVLVMGYLSGCFYPGSFLPGGIRVIGELLPSGVALQAATECISDRMSYKSIFGMTLYFVLFMGLTMVVRNHKILKKES